MRRPADGPAPETVELGPPGDAEVFARIICLRLLDQRARTRAELAAALHRRGVPEEAAGAVLDRFVDVGLIDDGALAEGYALAQHHERGLAGRAVALKLRRRGVPDSDIQTAVAQIDADAERAAAQRLVARKLRALVGVEPSAQARRLVGLLARRGYSPGLAHDVVRAAMAGQLPDDPVDG